MNGSATALDVDMPVTAPNAGRPATTLDMNGPAGALCAGGPVDARDSQGVRGSGRAEVQRVSGQGGQEVRDQGVRGPDRAALAWSTRPWRG